MSLIRIDVSQVIKLQLRNKVNNYTRLQNLMYLLEKPNEVLFSGLDTSSFD